MVETGDMNVLGCRGCCKYPNGKLGIAAFCVSIVGYILAWIASFSCSFFSITYEESSYYSYYEVNIGMGLWCATVLDSAYSYDNDYLGGATKFGRAMSIFVTILGFLAFVPTMSLACMSMPKLILKIVAILWVISGLCLLLMLSAMADCKAYFGDECNIGAGGALAIVAAIFYIVVAAIIFKIPQYDSDGGATRGSRKESQVKNVKAQPQGKNVTIETVMLPDGGQKTIKTTIDEDGNKTIEETIEEPREEQYPEEEVVYPEEEVVKRVLPDGSIQTTRTSYDEEGCKIVTETIEPGGSFSDDSV